ncbi:MAG TPA: PQQ-dependent sugar dehydrogenase [Vicinamibacterales bacterium]|nr:PQQ-dependent sugar dehydrogenase [Vicinamibacterales bacterium]
MRVVPVVLACGMLLSVAGEVNAHLRGEIFASGFQSPVAFVQDPTNRSVQFVVQQGGRIRVVRDGVVLPTDFLNLTTSVTSGGERGLLGLAFAPDYATSGRFFVNFTNNSSDSVVARFQRSTDSLVADSGSRFDLRLDGARRFVAQPFPNHNGGHLAFGPDGYLYIGLGDGGSGNDPDHRAQNPNELLGKMLRIDVNVPDGDPAGYSIPADNPFVGVNFARGEIWAFGLRNPWRYTFDDVTRGGTGALVIADVGQSRFEEIDYEPRGQGGRNYGWRNREGAHDNVTSRPLAYQPPTDPIFEYGRSDGGSVTGGYVYRGNQLGAGYRGRYFFADFISGRVWSIALSLSGSGEATASDRREHTTELGGRAVLGSVSSFGVDADGELYIVNYSGSVVRISGTGVTPATPTGLKIVKP